MRLKNFPAGTLLIMAVVLAILAPPNGATAETEAPPITPRVELCAPRDGHGRREAENHDHSPHDHQDEAERRSLHKPKAREVKLPQ
ncbi:hypothetical protein GCM10010470_43520 [Saccharopolyspora taberi]|uniref:Secreted protein n=1 Tax=Saccharopolyspora taberi TaxID=60895 RepID=A0ABN3VGQ5_9PSEU